MRLVVLGPPGAGKGTQCTRLARAFQIPHIGSGHTLREIARRDDPLGLRVCEALEQGRLVDDETVVAAMVRRLRQPDAQVGFLLDGFPRNLRQALALGAAMSGAVQWLDLVIVLDVSDEVALDRLRGRVEAVDSGEVFHDRYRPPPVGTEVTTRAGENRDAHERALREYREITEPMLEIYAERDMLVRLDATGSVTSVAERLVGHIAQIDRG